MFDIFDSHRFQADDDDNDEEEKSECEEGEESMEANFEGTTCVVEDSEVGADDVEGHDSDADILQNLMTDLEYMHDLEWVEKGEVCMLQSFLLRDILH